jgi:hypothetical protein
MLQVSSRFGRFPGRKAASYIAFYVHLGRKLLGSGALFPGGRQHEADRVRQMFVETVARNRNVDPQKLYDTEAATYMGADALPLLADSVGTFEDAVRLALMSKPQQETEASIKSLLGGFLAARRHRMSRFMLTCGESCSA